MTARQNYSLSLVARNSVFNLVGQVLPLFVGIVTIPYIVKGLGPVGFGILSISWVVLGYFSMFDLGLSRATTKFVAEHLNQDKVHNVPTLIWTSLSIQLVLGFVGAVAVASFVPFAVSHVFKMPAAVVGEAKASLLMLCASLPVLLGSNALRGVLEAAQRFDLVNYVKVPAGVSFYLLAALAIPFGVSVSGIVLLSVLSRIVAAGAYLVLCMRVFPSFGRQFSFSIEAARPLAAFGGWVMVSNTAAPIFIYLERFMIATLLPVSSLTFYSVPFELASKVLVFPGSIMPALFPYFSYHSTTVGTVVSDATARTVKYLLLVMTPITVVLVFFAREILRLWLGMQFSDQSTVILQILAITFFLNAFASVPYSSVQALGRPDLKAVLDVILLPAYAVFCWTLMKKMGINGAALAKLFITAADTTFLFVFAWKMKSISMRDCISGPLFRALLASVGLLASVFIIELLHRGVRVSFVLFIVCLGAYLVSFWFTAVDAADRFTFAALVRLILPSRLS
jgi:O-antigen/teichoic acid export membrane protein